MSKFTDQLHKTFDAIGEFISSGLHKIAEALHPLLQQVGNDLAAVLPEITAAALSAAVSAKQDGHEAAYQAAKTAALSKAEEFGIKEAGAVALSLRATAVNAAAQAMAQ